MAYVGNMGASGAFGALADFIKNRRGFKQETEDREMKRQMEELQRKALSTSIGGQEQRIRHEGELHQPTVTGLNLRNQGEEQRLGFDAEANPLRLKSMGQDLEIGDQRLQEGKLDITAKGIRTTALGNVASRPDADYFNDPDAVAQAALAGMNPREMVPGAKMLEADNSQAEFRSKLNMREASHGAALTKGIDANRAEVQSRLQGMPPATSNYINQAYESIQNNVWGPYRKLQESIEDDKRYYTQMAAQGMTGAEQVKMDLAARESQLAPAHAAAQASVDRLVQQAEQAILSYHQPGSPEYQRAMQTLQLMRQGVPAPAAAPAASASDVPF